MPQHLQIHHQEIANALQDDDFPSAETSWHV